MRKAIFAAVVLGIVGWLSLDCSAQSYGIPQGSRFQPVVTPGDGTRLGNEMLKGKSSKQAKQKKKPAAKPKVETTEEQDARRDREKEEKELQELAPKPRTWTDNTGKSTVEATFVELEEDQVTLRKKGGKEVTVPLSRLSKNDQEWAKTEARCQKIVADYVKKSTERDKKRADLEKEQKELLAKYGPISGSGPVDEPHQKLRQNAMTLSGIISSRDDLQKQRDRNIKEAVNAYCIAIGKEPLYVANASGDLEERGLEAAREARRNQREEQAKTNGTPRLAADNYIQGLLKNGTLQEATYVGEQFVTPGPQRSSTERAMGAALGVGGGGAGPLADPTKWKAVYYHVKYISRGGFAMEKDSYVLTYRVENARVIGAGARPEDGGLWAVENFYLDGVKGD